MLMSRVSDQTPLTSQLYERDTQDYAHCAEIACVPQGQLAALDTEIYRVHIPRYTRHDLRPLVARYFSSIQKATCSPDRTLKQEHPLPVPMNQWGVGRSVAVGVHWLAVSLPFAIS